MQVPKLSSSTMVRSNATMDRLANATIRPNLNFNEKSTAELLNKAMTGKGCNKEQIIQALCTIDNHQRQLVAHEFKALYGKDLVPELKKELSGDFENLIVALMERPDHFDAQQLHKAIAGLGTKESVLIETLVTSPNPWIAKIKVAYKQLYGKDLEKEIIGDTSGPFKELLVKLCDQERDQSSHIELSQANADARKLYEDGEKKFGVEPKNFVRVLATQNFNQLQAMFNEYEKGTGHSIEKAIEKEFMGDNEDGFLAVVKTVRNRDAFFAEQLHKTMKGLGTRDDDLIRLVVSRSEIDLGDIREEYQKLFKTSLEKSITDDCKGPYKDALIALVKGN